MANPQEQPKVMVPEATETDAGKKAGDVVTQGHAELAERADQLTARMADLYIRQLNAGVITVTDLRAIPSSENVPDWKKTAAKKALGTLDKEAR